MIRCARRRPNRRRTRSGSCLAVALVTLLAACSTSTEADPRLPPAVPTGAQVIEGLTYWADDSTSLALDACLPDREPDAPPSRAIVILHGGGFTSGDRVNGASRDLCQTAAALGQAAFSIDYRLAPAHLFPDQVDDLGNAVRWLRQPEQVQRFGIDPARIGVLGSSAGAIITQTLATRGQGPLDEGERVAAVVSLSGVSVMSPEGLGLGRPSQAAIDLVLGYLGCSSASDCPQAVPASPVTWVDRSDPPMLLVNGTGELVPREQADAMGAALEQAGVPAEVLIVDAPEHGTALLNETVRRRALSFLEEHL